MKNNIVVWQDKGDKILKSYYGEKIGRTLGYNSWATEIGLLLKNALEENNKLFK